jgi:hypothetical protein
MKQLLPFIPSFTIGILAISNLLTTHEDSISPTFPQTHLLFVLETIMDKNIFNFGDTYWFQLQGTAVGIPEAPLYSIQPFGQYENNQFLLHQNYSSTSDTLMTYLVSGVTHQTICGNSLKQN